MSKATTIVETIENTIEHKDMSKKDFIKTMVNLQKQNKNKWYYWVGTVDGVPVKIKAYGTWIQIMETPGVRDGGLMNAKVKDFKAYLEKRLS